MRPNTQASKHRSSHDTEREFGGALGESQWSALLRRLLHFYFNQAVLPLHYLYNTLHLVYFQMASAELVSTLLPNVAENWKWCFLIQTTVH